MCCTYLILKIYFDYLSLEFIFGIFSLLKILHELRSAIVFVFVSKNYLTYDMDPPFYIKTLMLF